MSAPEPGVDFVGLRPMEETEPIYQSALRWTAQVCAQRQASRYRGRWIQLEDGVLVDDAETLTDLLTKILARGPSGPRGGIVKIE